MVGEVPNNVTEPLGVRGGGPFDEHQRVLPLTSISGWNVAVRALVDVGATNQVDGGSRSV